MSEIPFLVTLIDLFPYGFLKIAILILTGMYIIFAFIVLRQEQLIAQMVEIPFSPILRIIVWLHVVAAIAAFVIPLLFL